MTERGGFDQTVDFVGSMELFSQLPELIAVGGNYYIIGYKGDVALPTDGFIAKVFSIHWSRSGHYTEMAELLKLIKEESRDATLTFDLRETDYVLA